MNPDPRAYGAGAARAAGPTPKDPRRWPALILLFSFVALMWVVEAADQVIQAAGGSPGLDDDGVRPLTTDGLRGSLFQPFLHGGWGHLIGNSIALLILGSIIALSGLAPLIRVTLVSWVASGVVSWLLGGVGTVHIGASGIVFGYIFYVIVRGLFTRSFLHLIIGVLIGFYYGLGALAGLSPLQDGVSWQGHLGGAIGGVVAAYGHKRDRKPRAVTAGQVRWTAGPPR